MRFTIGKRIQQLRAAAGMSGRQLANAAGIAPSFLSELENDLRNPTVATLNKLCDTLGITLADFFAPAGQGAEPLPAELRRLLGKARELTPEELTALQQFLDTITKRRRI